MLIISGCIKELVVILFMAFMITYQVSTVLIRIFCIMLVSVDRKFRAEVNLNQQVITSQRRYANRNCSKSYF